MGKGRGAAVRGYRLSVRRFLPRIAYAEALLHRSGFPRDSPGPALDRMILELRQSEGENGWDPYRRRAGIGTYALAGLIFVLPKVGILSELAIRGPSAATEALYVESVDRTVDALRATTKALSAGAAPLSNRDLDTGAKVRPGGYRLADETYAKLLERITREPGGTVSAGLKDDIDEFYSDPNAPISTKRRPELWARVQAELVELGRMRVVPVP